MILRNAVLIIAALVAEFVHGAFACTIEYSPTPTSPNFKVIVSDRGRPVQGLRLRLVARVAPEPAAPIEVVTNKDGVAEFKNAPFGFHSVRPVVDGTWTWADVEVSNAAPGNVTIPLKWPDPKPIRVKSASGFLRGPDFYPAFKQPQASLTLLEALSGEKVADTGADEKAHFSFPPVSPGLYFVRINPSGLKAWNREAIEGVLALEVDPAAARELDVDLGWSTCGLSYANRGRCETTVLLSRATLRGQVFDRAGAVVGRATVFLVRSKDNDDVIAKTTSDASGHFVLKAPTAGEFMLVVGAIGFNSLARRIEISRTEPVDSTNLRVRLGVLSRCSEVEVRAK